MFLASFRGIIRHGSTSMALRRFGLVHICVQVIILHQGDEFKLIGKCFYRKSISSTAATECCLKYNWQQWNFCANWKHKLRQGKTGKYAILKYSLSLQCLRFDLLISESLVFLLFLTLLSSFSISQVSNCLRISGLRMRRFTWNQLPIKVVLTDSIASSLWKHYYLKLCHNDEHGSS